MPRSTLPKAYLRIDPNLDHAKPGHLAVFVRLLCLASRQPVRGRFKTRRLLEQILGRAAAKRVVDEGDVVLAEEHEPCRDCPDGHGADGQLYVVGWDEWQEGDLTVGERQRRIRRRRNGHGNVTNRTLHNRDGPPPSTTTSTGTDRGVGRRAANDADTPTIPPIEEALSRLLRRSPKPRELEVAEDFEAELPSRLALSVIEDLIDARPERNVFGALLEQLRRAKAETRPSTGRAPGPKRNPLNDYDALAEGAR